jgi:hypothetical protein
MVSNPVTEKEIHGHVLSDNSDLFPSFDKIQTCIVIK